MDPLYKTVYNTQTKRAIDDFGRDVTVVYGDTAECNSCGYDPIGKVATNITCSTCGGQYYYQTEDSFTIKGVTKTFLGNMGFRDYDIKKYGIVPDSDARLNCWLPDVLVNKDSATGQTYLDSDKNVRVEFDGKKYIVDNVQRTGIDLTIAICVLKEIK